MTPSPSDDEDGDDDDAVDAEDLRPAEPPWLPPVHPRPVASSPVYSVGTGWLITFADLVSLMLTFFVMMFAMSAVTVEQWGATVESLTRRLNPENEAGPVKAAADYNIGTVLRRRGIDLGYLESVLTRVIAQQPLLAGAEVHEVRDRLIISLPSDLLFPPGTAVLSATARRAIHELGYILRNVRNRLGVMGHGDASLPGGKAAAYRSAWELSLGRAAAVANVLRQAGYVDDIVVYGAGGSRIGEATSALDAPRPVNGRRIDILVLPAAGR